VFLPLSTVKYLRLNVGQLDGLIRTHFALFERAVEHNLEHVAGHRENQLVAFKVLKCVHNLKSNLLRKCRTKVHTLL